MIFYPEYPFNDQISNESNYVYDGVRRSLKILKYDINNYNTPDWNPLGNIIQPGMTVFIKPNFVISNHAQKGNIWSIITHPSVLRAIIDYCWIALKGSGKIILGDAPQYDCNFDELKEIGGLEQFCDFFSSQNGPKFELLDLRNYWSRGKHFESMKEHLDGDPKGSISVNLGRQSKIYDLTNSENLYGAAYHRDETIKNHSGFNQNYELSRTIMESDVFISVPKMKVHKKVGVTLNIKGLVGINTNKNMIVHYRLKPPSKGGDQYPDNLFNSIEECLIKTERWMYDHLLSSGNLFLEYFHRSIYWLHNHSTKLLGLKVAEHKRLQDAGNWYGNDSAWRMTVDLARIIYYCDKNGNLKDTIQRKMFTFIDGVIGGENNGPLIPDAVNSGIIIAGDDLITTDIVATRLMGINPLKLKMYSSIINSKDFPLKDISTKSIKIYTDNEKWKYCLTKNDNNFCDYKPHPGWIGKIEIEKSSGN